ncbi:MAG: nucleotide exchange factor GrpE [Anaerolineae bacterium CG17_big_fil_post_rev_8_21_14_2_50_57_27]|nr:MAG: nucleotide exchange factor GrpE [Anaerolineae bacterium CG17_big_fil_post_rev_8_21_14_2_50_57_27]
MSNKKTRQDIEPENQESLETPAEIPAEPSLEAEAGQTVSLEEFEALKKQLEENQAQAAEYKDGWQRAVADFQNYRKRVERENSGVYQNALAEIIKSYLPIVDDLERALQSRPADLAWVEGIELIYRKLQAILEAEGVKRIEAEGQVFDPNLHEAISQEPAEGQESGRVIAVVQNGYMLGERVIRPAIVRVAQ